MTKSDISSDKKDLKTLMQEGGGLSGFRWPENNGHLEMEIRRNGSWFFQGSEIKRLKLCQLFATILQKDESGEHWLVTPVERYSIDVADSAFHAVELQVEGAGKEQRVSVRTTLNHWATIGEEEHSFRMAQDLDTQEKTPYIQMWNGLEARLGRAPFYELVDLCEDTQKEGFSEYGFWSCGRYFEVDRVYDD